MVHPSICYNVPSPASVFANKLQWIRSLGCSETWVWRLFGGKSCEKPLSPKETTRGPSVSYETNQKAHPHLQRRQCQCCREDDAPHAACSQPGVGVRCCTAGDLASTAFLEPTATWSQALPRCCVQNPKPEPQQPETPKALALNSPKPGICFQKTPSELPHFEAMSFISASRWAPRPHAFSTFSTHCKIQEGNPKKVLHFGSLFDVTSLMEE